MSISAFVRSILGDAVCYLDFVSLGDLIAETEYGLNNASSSNGNAKIVGIPNLHDGALVIKNCNYVSISDVEFERYRLRQNDILFNRTNSEGLVGKTVIVNEDTDAVFASYLVRLKVKASKIDPKFLNYWMNTDICALAYRRLSTRGVSQCNINATELKKHLPVPNLPLVEQQKIVEILLACDEAIGLLVNEKELVEKAIDCSILKIFRPYVCGSSVENHEQPIMKLGDLFSERVETGHENLSLVSITMKRGVIPREEVGRKDSSSDDKSKYRRICVGDIGYNTMRMWQGVSGLSSIDGIVSPAYTICTPDINKINPDWVALLFQEKQMIFQFWRYSQGLVNDTLGLKFHAFAEIKIRVPALKKQNSDVQYITSLLEHKLNLETQIHNFQQQKRGLMQQLLTGKLKVKVAA